MAKSCEATDNCKEIGDRALCQPAFGVAANITGQPIGGGDGYTSGPSRAEANFVVSTLSALQIALNQSKSGDIVWVEGNVVLKATTETINIPSGVTLASDRGKSGSLGALLETTHEGSDWFIIMGQNARLTGLRIKGQHPAISDIDENTSTRSTFAVQCNDGEVDNCEISHFRYTGVYAYRDSVACYVHHTYLHDIEVYPILDGSKGDRHVFEANRIHWTWHAIASTGRPGTGYTARFNEFLAIPRPVTFGNDAPYHILDVHMNNGEDLGNQPPTRLLVAEFNTFLAHPDMNVGDGSGLYTNAKLHPHYDIYVGSGIGLTTNVRIRRNEFLLNQRSASIVSNRPIGRAIRIVGLSGNPQVLDDPQPLPGILKVLIAENLYGNH